MAKPPKPYVNKHMPSNPKAIMYVEGLDGQIELLPDRVIIHRKGVVNTLFFGFNSRREIPLGQVSEVMFRDATRIKFGIIEFVRSGRSSAERKDSTQCIVKFNRATARRFEKLKDKTFELIEKNNKAKS